MSVQITDNFDNTSGEFTNYDAYETADITNIKTLKHRDIRVMQQSALSIAGSKLSSAERVGEAWSGGSVANDATRGGVRVLSVTLASGSNTISSVMTLRPVDLLTDFSPTDHISIAFPTFPAGTVTQSTSFVDFTSSLTGDFSDSTRIASVALSASLTTLAATDSEFRVLRSAFQQNDIDLSAITGVRFRIQASGANTLRIMAIRLLAADWTLGLIDLDTRYRRLTKAIPRNGDMTQGRFTQPILWRSDDPASPLDPKPIDSEVAVTFNSGSLVSSNSISLYFREVTEDFMTMLDLNDLTMADLNGRIQPDVGTARYNSRTMDDLAQFTHDELYGETMFSLERKADYLSASWINFILTWSSSVAQLQMGNTESGNSAATGVYTFPLNLLTANTNYVWFAKLDENSVHSVLYTLAPGGGVGAKVFDSTVISDDGAFRRRKGRFGWHADIRDGGAYIDSIRMRKVNYAEYRSLPFRSITPVGGAELYFAGSGNVEHFVSLDAHRTVSSTLINRDTSRSISGSSWRLDNLEAVADQGVASNPFLLEDLEDTEISFDLWYSADAGAYPLKPYLFSEGGHMIPLSIPEIKSNQWQRFNLKLPDGQMVLTGTYRLLLLQTIGSPLSWWIDNISISTRSLTWEARSVIDDPWGSNLAPWVPFKNALNKENAGILFPLRGNDLQVRAKATTQAAHIDRVQFKPRYAQLGRFKPKDFVRDATAPSASFTSSSEGSNTVLFTSTSGQVQSYQVDNLIENPSFEVDVSKWISSFGATTARQTGWSAAGSASVRLTTSAMGVAGQQGIQAVGPGAGAGTNRWPVTPGEFLSSAAQFNVLSRSGNGQVYIQHNYYDAAGSYLSSTIGNQSNTVGIFRSVIAGVTVPPNAAWVGVFLIANEGSPNPPTTTIDMYADAVQLHRTENCPDYFDGATNSLTSWLGTAHSSASRRANPTTYIVSNEWNFGDGTTGTGDVVRHKYPAPGTYTVTLVSMDNKGNRNISSTPVTV